MLRKGIPIAIGVACALAAAAPAEARVTHLVIDSVANLAAVDGGAPYKRVIGRAFGQLDPSHPANAIITDIQLAQRVGGMVNYEVSFQLVHPADLSLTSGLMWHDVPNRGGRITISNDLRLAGDIGLSSGWQGDNSGTTATNGTRQVAGREWVKVPIAKNPDGSAISGRVMGRILNPSDAAADATPNVVERSHPMIVHSNPLPYLPATLDTAAATLVEIDSETIDGQVGPSRPIPAADWAFARCNRDGAPAFPGTPDGTQVCMKNGFKPNHAYQVVFTAKDPTVLGIGFAAFRDLASFLKFETTPSGAVVAGATLTGNPLAGRVQWVLGRGSSQSGNFLRAFLHLGFNQDEAGRQVQDGTWPIIAGRRVSLNQRFAMPDGVLKLYEPGSEGPQWWHQWPDTKRGLPPAGILDRCEATKTCPKIIEHFGAAEVWGLKLGPEWVGTDPRTDIPLPKNVRRYYISSTDHGGGDGGFSTDPGDVSSCPSVGYGVATYGDNPMPHTETVNAIRYHFRRWVMQDIQPPESMWPRLRGKNGERTLVEPTKEAMGFPSIPGVPATAPTGLINPVLDYDFGDRFDYTDASGIVDVVPPRVKQVIAALVPKVDADGNELGGVPVVLREAPLGTYMGWNIVDGGFHDGKICAYNGGWIPFARSKADRLASGDPRLSLEERYVNHAGYVAAVTAAAARAVASGFLLEADAARLIAEADASDVLN